LFQREFLQFKKQQREENLILRKQEAENVAKQAEAQLLSAEAGIMAIDIDKVAPHLKNYYIGMQRQIMERRGFPTSDPNDACVELLCVCEGTRFICQLNYVLSMC
jgi:hypothetical protein